MTTISSAPGDQTGASSEVRAGSTGHVHRIGFFGFFGIGNFGNDGSLDAVLQRVRAANPCAELLCICGRPDIIESRFGIRAARINWSPRNALLQRLDRVLLTIPRELASIFCALGHLIYLDLLIIPGTGILDDYGTGPRGMPYWLFRWSVLARLTGTKVLFVSIGAGPIHNRLSRWLMKASARMAAYRSYRDRASKSFMKSIGFDVSRDPIYPDVAFALPTPADVREPSAEGQPVTVGVGVMSYNGWRDDRATDESIYRAYMDKMEVFIRWLLAAGYRVRLLTGQASDQGTARELCARIEAFYAGRDRPNLVVAPASSLQDVMAQIADTDVVVATRYHNVVCALKLGRPTLSIGYADKNDNLLADMGLGDFCQHIERLDGEMLVRQFQRLVADRKIYERQIRDCNERFTDSLIHQNALLIGRYL